MIEELKEYDYAEEYEGDHLVARPVLDKGGIRLVDVMGTDISVVNSARASYGKRSTEMTPGNERLISFLAKGGHTSPFRHAFMSFEFKAPLEVARQHWKYVVGGDHSLNSWNEACFSPDQQVVAWPYKGGQRKKYTVKQLYDMAQINKYYLPRIPSMNAIGEIVPNKIKDVFKTNEADVFRVVSELGFEIKTTGNHRYMTPDGYKRLDQLSPGDEVIMNGVPAYKDKIWLHRHYVELGMWQKDIAKIANCSVHTIRKYVTKFGLQQDQIARMHAHNKEFGVYGSGLTAADDPKLGERGKASGDTQRGVRKTRGPLNGNYQFNNTQNGNTMRARARTAYGDNRECVYCGGPGQIHHIDENPANNEVDNLIAVCQSHHDMLHDKRPLIKGHPIKIKSIELIGKMDVYDIEMTDSPNLVVEQFVVHNSGRYITKQDEFYTPSANQWRSKPENSKQGSGPLLSSKIGSNITAELMHTYDEGEKRYQWALEQGVAPEMARLFLPAYGLYTFYYWSASLQSILHFLNQRLASDAQHEITDYAKVVYDMVKTRFPISTREFVDVN